MKESWLDAALNAQARALRIQQPGDTDAKAELARVDKALTTGRACKWLLRLKLRGVDTTDMQPSDVIQWILREVGEVTNDAN